ncbi:hypothetical protein evm_010849 [Chilo suppressalis]|nr:hypothetical protein evm_010849 [Chilo suppressalis]
MPRLLFVVEVHEQDLAQKIGRALKTAEEKQAEVRISDSIVQLDRENEDEAYRKLCSAVSKGASMLVDLSWSPWGLMDRLASETGLPIVRTLLGSQQLLSALDKYLESRNATDAAILMESEGDVDRALYELLGRSSVRVWVHAGLTRDSARALKTMRPEPSFYVIVGESGFVLDTYRRAVKEKLVRRDYRWNLVLTDYAGDSLDTSQIVLPTMLLQVDQTECCKLLGREDCTCPSDQKRKQYVLSSLLQYLAEVYFKLEQELPMVTTRVDCDNPQSMMNGTRERLTRQFSEDAGINNETLFYWDDERSALLLRSRFELASYKPDEGMQTLASWSADEGYKLLPGVTLEPLKMFFRIGTSPSRQVEK